MFISNSHCVAIKRGEKSGFITLVNVLNKYEKFKTYRMAHEKPARRLVDQRGRRSRTLYRKLNKCEVLTG